MTTRESRAHGHLQLGLAGNGGLRWALTELTEVAEVARLRRDLGPEAAIALAQLMAGTALVARMVTKVPTRLMIEARGDGPLGRVLAEVDEHGNLRGMVENPRQDHATSSEGKDSEESATKNAAESTIDVKAGLGSGTLRVIRQTEKGNYESHVPLVEGGVGENLAAYLEQSEQIHSAVLLGALARSSGIAAAGGLIVEALPGVDEDVLAVLESRLAQMPGVSRVLEESSAEGLLRAALGELDIEVLENRRLRLHCHCDRERFRRQIVALPVEDREHLEVNEGTTEAECAFCGQKYVFTADELSPPAQ